MVIKIPQYIKEILAILNSYGEAYVVGGCVRDSLLNLTPNDWDITTDRTPEEIKEIFKDYKIINKNGEKHGTITIFFKRRQIEITTYREDKNYLDGRHPSEVTFTRTLKNDLARRDFTINAMAYNEKIGLVDLFGGITDLKNKLIKTVGDPYKRFSEDYLRIIRGLRFVSKLGFNMEEYTLKASLDLAPKILKYISGERIREELKGILLGYNVFNTLINYKDIIANFIPELKPCFGFNQNNPYHAHDVYCHICYVVSYTKPDFISRLAALLHDIGKPQAYSEEIKDGKIRGHFYNHADISLSISRIIANRLKLSNEEKSKLYYLVKEHDSLIEPNKRLIKRLIIRTPNESKELLFQLLDLKQADQNDHLNVKPLRIKEIVEIINEIYEDNEALKISDLKINGNDLMKLGYQGKEIGQNLKELFNAVLNEEVANDYDELVNYLRKGKI